VDSHLTLRHRGFLTLAAALLCTLGLAASAHAMTTYNVTPGDATSLRDAFNSANTDGDDSTINVPAGHYTLNPSDSGLEVFGDGTFTLVGAGARTTIIDGGATPVIGQGGTTDDSLITIFALCKCPGPAHATISGVTLTGADPDEDGGAVWIGNAGPAAKASLHIFDSTITANQSENDGGGIFNEGDLTVERVTFSNNAAEADGSAIATKSRDGADLRNDRGFIQQNFATTSITNSTFTGNTSDSDTGCEGGGAVEQEGGNTTIVNSTIIGNTSLDGTCEPVQPTGGGIDIEAGPATIVNSIVTGNTASPSEESTVRGGGGPVLASNCSVDPVVKGNAGTLTSLGHNIESATDCGFTASGDQQNVADPKVGALGNTGGQMDTMALLAGSPAIDTADAAACPATDEIGPTRPQGPACDVGAYEVPVAAVVTPPPSAKPAAPTIGVAGVRRACVASSFHVRFRVGTANSTVKKVVVKLDGKRIKSTARGSFTLTINGKKLKSGKHRLRITATNAAGQTKTVVRSFSVCKAAKPRQKAAPRFTG
jgi:hypothetical protein